MMCLGVGLYGVILLELLFTSFTCISISHEENFHALFLQIDFSIAFSLSSLSRTFVLQILVCLTLSQMFLKPSSLYLIFCSLFHYKFYTHPRICILILEKEEGREKEKSTSINCLLSALQLRIKPIT